MVSFRGQLIVGGLLLAFVAGDLVLSAHSGVWQVWTRDDTYATEDEARIAVDRTECSLGTITKSDGVTAEFTVRNEGTRRLLLREQDSNCCGSSARETIIFPGNAKTLAFEIGSDSLAAGPQTKVVHYETNDPAHPNLVFTMHFTIASSQHPHTTP